jgi:hypothetical protein
MEQQGNIINVVFENFHQALRYIASGFITFAVLSFLNWEIWQDFLNGSEYVTLFYLLFIIILGILNYAIHIAFLDKLFYRLVIYLYFRCHKIPEIITDSISEWDEKTTINGSLKKPSSKKPYSKKISFVLFSQTYLRKISEKNSVRGIQSEIDKRLALLMFLYCSSYSLIIIPVLYLIKHKICEHTFPDSDFCTFWIKILSLIGFGVFVLIIGLTFDKRILKREIWALEYFPQKEKGIQD